MKHILSHLRSGNILSRFVASTPCTTSTNSWNFPNSCKLSAPPHAAMISSTGSYEVAVILCACGSGMLDASARANEKSPSPHKSIDVFPVEGAREVQWRGERVRKSSPSPSSVPVPATAHFLHPAFAAAAPLRSGTLPVRPERATPRWHGSIIERSIEPTCITAEVIAVVYYVQDGCALRLKFTTTLSAVRHHGNVKNQSLTP